jgi:hypothetical protein
LFFLVPSASASSAPRSLDICRCRHCVWLLFVLCLLFLFLQGFSQRLLSFFLPFCVCALCVCCASFRITAPSMLFHGWGWGVGANRVATKSGSAAAAEGRRAALFTSHRAPPLLPTCPPSLTVTPLPCASV